MSKRKRVAILADLHCGHHVGLTPPDWQYPESGPIGAQQAEMWAMYCKWIDKCEKIDIAIWNGDLIDGTGSRSGGSEQITTDRRQQVNMAAACIDRVNAATNIIVYGTPYHVGPDGEDWEAVLSDKVGAAKVEAHGWYNINGCIFDIKHKVGSSSIPHGRHTPIARERLWNILWNERGQAPKANVLIRSHVHYHTYSGGPGWLAITTPALQGLGSKYGSRQCSGTVDFGFLTFDVDTNGGYTWTAHVAIGQTQISSPLTL